jgi:hypothetical protein
MVVDVPDEWHTMPDGSSKRIDEYGNNVVNNLKTSGDKTFDLLSVVKHTVWLAHGSADPECGFGVNK